MKNIWLNGVLFDGQPGVHIKDAIAETIQQAKSLRSRVYLQFNDVLLRIDPDSDANELYKEYDAKISRKNDVTAQGMFNAAPKEKLSTALNERDTLRLTKDYWQSRAERAETTINTIVDALQSYVPGQKS